MLHSDIKPDNILIDDDMRPRLADFDVSQSTASRRTFKFAQSTMSVVGGTVGFIAPEVLKGGASELTSKADVFSLGKSFELIARESSHEEDFRPLLELLRRMTDEEPDKRPTAAEVATLAQAALGELVKVEADRARSRVQHEVEQLEAAQQSAVEREQSAMEAAQQSDVERKHLQQLQASLNAPSYWEHRLARASSDWFALISLDSSVDAEAWQALSSLLDTDGSELGRGADHKHKSSPYNRLQLAAAWRIENHDLWDKYAGGLQTVATGLKRVLNAGKPRRNVDSKLNSAGSLLPGALQEAVDEAVLLHGTEPSKLLSILSTGLNEHFSGTSSGTAFGYGIYFADDAGKTDHYVTMDTEQNVTGWRSDEAKAVKALHTSLYQGGRVCHPGRVFYLLVCRVATGYVVRTKDHHNENMTSMDTGERIFPLVPTRRGQAKAVTRELELVSGVDPPVRHHTLLAENHARGGPYRYREFVVFQNAHCYPEYLIAYQRFRGSYGPLA